MNITYLSISRFDPLSGGDAPSEDLVAYVAPWSAMVLPEDAQVSEIAPEKATVLAGTGISEIAPEAATVLQ